MLRVWRAILLGLCLFAAALPAGAAGPAFKDLPETHWAYGAVAELRAHGVIAGDDDGLFHPDRPATRAELFKMVLLARGVVVGSECKGIFADVPCTAWYAPVAEMAYRLALTEGQGEKRFGPTAPVTREELFTVANRALGRHLEADRMNWGLREERMRWFTDGDDIAAWARAPVALMVGDGHVKGYGDGSFRPKVHATRAEVAALVHRVLLRTGGQTATVDGVPVRFSKQMEMVASMYATGEPGVGTVTYSGLTVRQGIVATDPSVIPLGTLLYVEGYGYAVAADIGGAIKGNRIDLFTYNYERAAIEFGLQNRNVYLLP